MVQRFASFMMLAWVSMALVPSAWAQKPKEPKWTHAFDLAVRPYGKSEFDDKTPKYGVEVFKDTNTGYGIYISQAGSLAAAPGFDAIAGAIKDSKGPEWAAGLDLPCRQAGKAEFDKSTKVWSMEVFRDPNTGNWIYITETARLAVTPGKRGVRIVPGSLKAPKWVHSVDLRCRKGGQREWKDTPKYGIEVYRDGNTGNLVYICETGSVAVIPEADDVTPPAEGKAPEWLHGLDLAVRRHEEADFTHKTRKFGVEIFRDENNGNLICITETGSIAVAGGKKGLTAPTPNVKEPQWTHGLNLSCRPFGTKIFDAKTPMFGSEIFRDGNTGLTLYITEEGVISAVPSKASP